MRTLVWFFCFFMLAQSKSAERPPRKKAMLQQRVIKGTRASLSDWPYIVYMNFHQPEPIWKTCGGALIGRKFVLTVAHCVEDIANHPKYVTIGARRTERIAKAEANRNFTVSKIFIHPKFEMPAHRNPPENYSFDYDIAILRLSSAVQGPGIPIALPTKDVYLDQPKVCKVAGWGATREFKTKKDQDEGKYTLSMHLMQTELPLVSKQKCIEDDDVSDFHMFGPNLARLICTGKTGPQETSSICTGDSGSPLVCKDKNNINILQGLVSVSTEKCEAGNGHLYMTQVSKYRKWIDKVMDGE